MMKNNTFTSRTTETSLTYFDERYILTNGVDTLPLGHYSLREDAMFREVSEDVEWGNDVLREKKKDIHPTQANTTKLPIFSLPDPRFFHNPITEDEIFDVINIVELSDADFDPPSTDPNIFLDMEGSEVPSNSPPSRKSQI